MKAFIYKSYGAADVLELVAQEIPLPQKGEVQIEVKAISINPRDANIRNGDLRFISGKEFPKLTGADFSGIISKLGEGISNFKTGDEVFGYIEDVKNGASAEYIVLPEKYLALKPKELSFEVASALGCAYLTALQTLRDKCKIKSGDRLAIYGASGGVGIAAIQLAKYFGASITAIANSANESLCKNQGVDNFIAYDKTDVFSLNEKFDIFFQVYSKEGSLYKKVKALIKASGIFCCLIPDPRFYFKTLFARPRFTFILVKSIKSDLDFLANLAREGKIKPVISKQLKLEEMMDAHKQIDNGHTVGKIVITM